MRPTYLRSTPSVSPFLSVLLGLDPTASDAGVGRLLKGLLGRGAVRSVVRIYPLAATPAYLAKEKFLVGDGGSHHRSSEGGKERSSCGKRREGKDAGTELRLWCVASLGHVHGPMQLREGQGTETRREVWSRAH